MLTLQLKESLTKLLVVVANRRGYERSTGKAATSFSAAQANHTLHIQNAQRGVWVMWESGKVHSSNPAHPHTHSPTPAHNSMQSLILYVIEHLMQPNSPVNQSATLFPLVITLPPFCVHPRHTPFECGCYLLLIS